MTPRRRWSSPSPTRLRLRERVVLGAMGSPRLAAVPPPSDEKAAHDALRKTMSCDPRDFNNFVKVLVAQAFAVQCKRHREDSTLSATASPQQADHSAPHNQPTTRKLNQRMASAEAFTPGTVHRPTQKSHGPKHGTPLKPNTAALQGTSLKPVPPPCTTVPLSPINGVSSPTTDESAPPLFSPAALAGVFIPADAFNGSRPGWVQ